MHAYIAKAKPERLGGRMLEIVGNIFSSPMGEYAAMGTFTPGWVNRLEDGRVTPVLDL